MAQKRFTRKIGRATETFFGDIGGILAAEGRTLVEARIAQHLAPKPPKPPVPIKADAYEVLGVTKDMDTDTIRGVWKAQATIFHEASPGNNPDRLTQINSAWAEIKKDRGLGKNDIV